MSEAPAGPSLPEGVSAGRLLREARQSQGMHISALASAIKVTPRKLEALEADRFDELPDATFTRALAQTVCRALKIDAAPVLALLPRAGGGRGLGHLGEGLNTPFREGYGHAADNDESLLGRPAVWAPLVVLLIAAAVYFAPAAWFDLGRDRPDASAAPGGGAPLAVAPVHASPGRAKSGAGTTVSVAASAVAALPAPAVARVPGADAASAAGSVGADRVAMNEASPEASAGSNSAGSNSAARLAGSASMAAAAIALASAPAGASAEAPPVLLQLHAVRDSWIEVTDVHGQALLSRTLKSGERVGLEGDLPLRLRIGNVAGTEVSFRGRAVALEPYNRNNLARFELK